MEKNISPSFSDGFRAWLLGMPRNDGYRVVFYTDNNGVEHAFNDTPEKQAEWIKGWDYAQRNKGVIE